MLYPLSYGRAGDSVAQTGAGLRGDLRAVRGRDDAPSCGIAREVNMRGCARERWVALGPPVAKGPKVTAGRRMATGPT